MKDVTDHSKAQSSEVHVNQNLITVMKEAKEHVEKKPDSNNRLTASSTQQNEMILSKEEQVYENPYILKMMKEMLARKNSTPVNQTNQNLSQIMGDILQDDELKRKKMLHEVNNENLTQIMSEIIEHDSTRGSIKSSNNETSIKSTNLINIAHDAKSKEKSGSTQNLNHVISTDPRISSSKNNPRQVSSKGGDFTKSSIDIYAKQNADDIDSDELDSNEKNRAFSRLSSPDISDEATRLKYSQMSHPNEPNLQELSKPLGQQQRCGLIRVTAHYDELRSRLSITVHEAK